MKNKKIIFCVSLMSLFLMSGNCAFGVTQEECQKSECLGLSGGALLNCQENCQKKTNPTVNLDDCVRNSCAGLSASALLSCRDDCQKKSIGVGVTNPPGAPGAQGGGSTSITFPNPLQFDTIEGVVASVTSNLQGVMVTLAIMFIVLGGVVYIASAGNEAAITRAKSIITAAVIGLAIVLAGPTFLKEVRKIMGVKNPSSVDAAPDIATIAANALSFLLSIVGVLAIIALVYGGAMYLTAYGDENRMKEGKKVITWAIVGIIVSLSAVVIVRQVMKLFGM